MLGLAAAQGGRPGARRVARRLVKRFNARFVAAWGDTRCRELTACLKARGDAARPPGRCLPLVDEASRLVEELMDPLSGPG